MNGRLKTLLGSKTVWGTLLATGAWLLQQPHVDVQIILQALGVILGGVGVRDAIGQSTPSSTPSAGNGSNSGGSGA